MADAVDLIVGQWREERPDLSAALEPMEVMGRIQRMQRVHEQHFRKLRDAFGLAMGEIDMLFTLRRSGPPYTLTAGAFLKAAMVTAGAVTNRIDRLEDKGLVERVRESADRRSVQIRLTEHGKAVADDMITTHLREYERILSALGARQREQIASGLRAILEAHDDTTLA
ncbi:MarR family transcriptional regulator [Streptomyces sp. RFCAC02]|uniref:MarR family winged helix-turn-helix transcriptional regulator n=1 Tax=Streptomyces sp. RFCAC02 TaxID=2499143 RepID=UPI0010226180|nr:MarR family transcriptional regulator [Streptomyces sp. RFCAC02]